MLARIAMLCLVLQSSVDLSHPMSDLLSRVTIDPEQCGGRPCIRGMRIRVTDVLDLLAAGLSAEQVLDELPDLNGDDVRAALWFASRNVDGGRPIG